MPLHKSSRAPRLDPTMISAPLGDFRHTMHIGRGGDAFGDTSFLSTQGPASTDSSNSIPAALASSVDSETLNHDLPDSDYTGTDASRPSELQHSESVSSFDLDLDLGPSILGDVLGVMDGLGLDSNWTTSREGEEEDVFSPSKSAVEVEQPGVTSPVSIKNEINDMNEKKVESVDVEQNGEKGEEQLNEGTGLKSKGLRPKVRFSDKREEIIGQQEEGEGLEVEGEEVEGEEVECVSPTEAEHERGSGAPCDKEAGEAEPTNHRPDSPPSPTSSLSSEYEGVSPLDRRREDERQSETDSEEEEEEEEEEEGVDGKRGYTFEDEFDDEIGL